MTRILRTLPALAVLTAALASCAPVSPDLAAQRCEERARTAAHPTGYVAFGASTDGGARSKGEVTISTDWLMRRDPMVVYDQCVRDLSGQGPIRPPDLDP